MVDAFHVEAISWHSGGITLVGKSRRLGSVPFAAKPTHVVAWNEDVRVRERAAAPARLLDWDGVFAFALFMPMLFILQFGTWGALLFSAVTSVCAVSRRR